MKKTQEFKVESYFWYLKRTFRLFTNPPLELLSGTFDDFKEMFWSGMELLKGIFCLVLIFLLYLFFPITFPILAIVSKRRDIECAKAIDKKIDDLHEAMKPNPKKEK